jgi:single-strand DNA-binding protein
MSLNQVTLIGRLGRDPVLRKTASEQSVCSFPLAVDEVYKDRKGEKRKTTVWITIQSWAGLAETAAKYLKKGREVNVVGKLVEPGVYTPEGGEPKADLRVRASEINFIGGRDDEGG